MRKKFISHKYEQLNISYITLRYCHHVDFSVFRSFNSFKREIGLKYQKGVGSLTEYPAALE